jgi:hypothetical protein
VSAVLKVSVSTTNTYGKVHVSSVASPFIMNPGEDIQVSEHWDVSSKTKVLIHGYSSNFWKKEPQDNLKGLIYIKKSKLANGDVMKRTIKT